MAESVDMEFGVHLPHLGRQVDREHLIEFARAAESLGFESGWASDHIVLPVSVASRYPYTATGEFPVPSGMPWLDPIGTLLFVAGCTDRLKLGTTVLILGYRPPVQTAKLLSTLDVLSGGRLILGVGVGWMKEEFDALGMPFDHRGARADEQLEIFETLFAQPLASYEGRYYKFQRVGFQPKPPRGHITIWVGGDSEPAFQRAARFGDGFHAAFTPAAQLAEQWARVRELCEQQHRDPAALTLSVRLYLGHHSAINEEVAVHGSVDQMLDTIGRYAAAGVTQIVLDITAPGGVTGRMEAMQHFAEDVRPKLG